VIAVNEERLQRAEQPFGTFASVRRSRCSAASGAPEFVDDGARVPGDLVEVTFDMSGPQSRVACRVRVPGSYVTTLTSLSLVGGVGVEGRGAERQPAVINDPDLRVNVHAVAGVADRARIVVARKRAWLSSACVRRCTGALREVFDFGADGYTVDGAAGSEMNRGLCRWSMRRLHSRPYWC
jgi:hypothetical protein